MINSAVVKLSKLTVANSVYRGVSGGRLPLQFRVANDYGVRGGVDPAFMSTTLDREVALTYAASGGTGGPGVVFSIKQGMVDRGADIGWLSQVSSSKASQAIKQPAASTASHALPPPSLSLYSTLTRRRSSSLRCRR